MSFVPQFNCSRRSMCCVEILKSSKKIENLFVTRPQSCLVDSSIPILVVWYVFLMRKLFSDHQFSLLWSWVFKTADTMLCFVLRTGLLLSEVFCWQSIRRNIQATVSNYGLPISSETKRALVLQFGTVTNVDMGHLAVLADLLYMQYFLRYQDLKLMVLSGGR